MDPTETVRLIVRAIEAGKMDVADDHAADLAAWLARGGFAPSNLDAALSAFADTLEDPEDWPHLAHLADTQ